MKPITRTILAAVLAIAALNLAGCATTDAAPAAAPASSTAAAPAPVDPRTAYLATVGECAAAIKDIATNVAGDTATRVVAMGAIERLCGANGPGNALASLQAPPAQPQSLVGVLFQAALQAGDVILRGYGIKAGRDVAIAQSNNATTLGISTNRTFATLGGAIERAGVAGYPFVQAPAANVTTTTLSGTGVLGSGSYVGPVTTTTSTTRNCQGGAAGAGAGTTTGAPGGAGGSATC